MSKLKYGEAQFLYSEINALKEPTREIRKKLDTIEEVVTLHPEKVKEGALLSDDSDILLSETRIFSEQELDAMLPENINRGQRKTLEYLLLEE